MARQIRRSAVFRRTENGLLPAPEGTPCGQISTGEVPSGPSPPLF